MAGNAFQKGKKKEENPNTCRDIIASNDSPHSQRCNVSSITPPEPKIRIRIPKLLAKTMQRRSDDDCITDHLDDHTRAKKERVVQPKSFLPQKLGLFFSSVFGKKKSPKASSKVHKNGDGYKSDVAVVDGGLHDGDQPLEVAPKSPLHLLEIEEEEEEERENGKPAAIERRENKPSRAADMELAITWLVVLACRRLQLQDRKAAVTCLGIHQGYPVRGSKIGGKPGQAGEESREESGDELCKKRILMGEKCKPLNLSGSLHYDEDGILLPEMLLR
ncbi:hypothetical protein OIU85_005194 [Salix viminalis]|uniref:Uncharacterized protein n=1 Tax=Salix viminalis TaxID=40686 RepID=A0A9Q0SYK5_SALVM|nr:hypothetical protein OIU85_005194 [Salix viminalis]